MNCFGTAVKHPVKVRGQASAPRQARGPVVAKRARYCRAVFGGHPAGWAEPTPGPAHALPEAVVASLAGLRCDIAQLAIQEHVEPEVGVAVVFQ